MSALPFDHPGARIAFDVVVGAFVLSELWIRLRSERNRQGSRVDRTSLLVVQAAVIGGVGGAVLLARRLPGAALAGAQWPLIVAGLVLMCAGIALRQWAVATLGRFFTIDVRLQPSQTVVDRGPYRWVRHPSYTGLILTFLGFGLALGELGCAGGGVSRADRRPGLPDPLRGARPARGPRRAVSPLRRQPPASVPRRVVT